MIFLALSPEDQRAAEGFREFVPGLSRSALRSLRPSSLHSRDMPSMVFGLRMRGSSLGIALCSFLLGFFDPSIPFEVRICEPVIDRIRQDGTHENLKSCQSPGNTDDPIAFQAF
jgi:hypothetical protein